MLPALLILPTLSVGLALVPLRKPFPLAVAAWGLGLVAMEVPLHLSALVVLATASALLHGEVTTADLVGTAMAALICAGSAAVLTRHRAAGRVLDKAWEQVGMTGRATTVTTTPWLRILLQPWFPLPRDVRAQTGLIYGPDSTANRCDLYTKRGHDDVRGVLIHLHGGHFRMGAPSRESRAMLFDHAQRGWACISSTYHLASPPEAGFPEHLVDIKRLLRWIRVEGPDHGIPADAPIVVSGSSAGAHIATMMALTAGDPRFQPGFEDVDTSLVGAIGLYGYYGPLGPETKTDSDPVRHTARDAPPFLVVHGTLDTYTPVKGSRRLVSHLRAGSPTPVIYAELPGAQHGFDAVRTPRYLSVVAATRRFTDTLCAPS